MGEKIGATGITLRIHGDLSVGLLVEEPSRMV